MPEQLDIFGQDHDWQDTTPKAQAKGNSKVRRQEKQDYADNLVHEWMRELGYPVSVRELCEKLEPVGLKPSTTHAAMKRLRHQARIEVAGEPDENCEQYQILKNARWQPSHT